MAKAISIKEYLTAVERAKFGIEELTDLTRKYNECKEDRKDWDKNADFGRMIQNNDFSFMDSLLRKKSNTTKTWGINFIKTNIKYSNAATIAATVKVNLKNERGSNPKGQQLLKAETNYAIDKFNLLRKSDQCLEDVKYTGMTYIYVGWDDLNHDDTDWFTGIPIYKPILPEKVWIDPYIEEKDKSDMHYLFHREQHRIKSLKRQFPKLADQIPEATENEDGRSGRGIVDVVRCQYMVKVPIERRAIVSEATGKVRYHLESEYEDYIKTKAGSDQLSEEELESLKDLGEENDETVIFSETINATKKIKSILTCWYEMIFIPEHNLILEKPHYIGNTIRYAVMSGERVANSSYSCGEPTDNRDLIEATILMMTIQLYDTIKRNRPIIGILPGSILNEDEVRNNWGHPNLTVLYNEVFFAANTHLRPRDAITVQEMPQMGQMQVLLNEKLEQAAEKAQNSPNVRKGIQDYAQQPAKAIVALQQASIEGGKATYNQYKEFLRQSFEILKNLIAENRDYEHEIRTLLSSNTSGIDQMEKVNHDSESMLIDAAIQCKVQVLLDENSEMTKAIKEQKALQLYGLKDEHGMSLITTDDFLRSYIPDEAETIIKNREQRLEESQNLVESPEIQNMMAQAMQQNPQLNGANSGNP